MTVLAIVLSTLSICLNVAIIVGGRSRPKVINPQQGTPNRPPNPFRWVTR